MRLNEVSALGLSEEIQRTHRRLRGQCKIRDTSHEYIYRKFLCSGSQLNVVLKSSSNSSRPQRSDSISSGHTHGKEKLTLSVACVCSTSARADTLDSVKTDIRRNINTATRPAPSSFPAQTCEREEVCKLEPALIHSISV